MEEALALFCRDLCFLSSFIPKPITSLLLKKKTIKKKCKLPYPAAPTARSLCPWVFLDWPPDPVESGESSSRGSVVWDAEGAEDGLRAQTHATPRGKRQVGL